MNGGTGARLVAPDAAWLCVCGRRVVRRDVCKFAFINREINGGGKRE